MEMYYQNCSVLYSVRRLCTTHTSASCDQLFIKICTLVNLDFVNRSRGKQSFIHTMHRSAPLCVVSTCPCGLRRKVYEAVERPSVSVRPSDCPVDRQQ